MNPDPALEPIHFDIIFSSRNFQKATELNDLLLAQERGDGPYLEEVLGRLAELRAALAGALGPDAHCCFGFNTTSSIGAMLPVLPREVIATTKEFPPIVALLDRAGKCCVGLFDTDRRDYLELQEPADDEVLLLLSHVSYLEGDDLAEGVLTFLEAGPLAGRGVHLVVDGAHAIANHLLPADLPALEQAYAGRLDLRSFTYVFDFHKWVQGFMGMSVVVSTSERLCRALDSVFPNTLLFDGRWARFERPISVSFNPVLVYWLLNLRHRTGPLFDRGATRASRELTEAFLRAAGPWPGIELGPPNANNLVGLRTADARRLHGFLAEGGLHTHLIGGRTIQTPRRTVDLPHWVRLAFSSQLVTCREVDLLLQRLADYR